MLGTLLVFFAGAKVTAPELTWMAYLGGSGTDDCDGIAVDSAGDIYLACHSDSPDFPHLPPKAASPSRDAIHAIVVKIDARSGRLVWVTRTGGSGWDAAGDLTVSRDGTIYVLGQTQSADFPTTADAVQRRFGGPARDVFLLKLDSKGTIVYSTLLGGSKNDEPGGMAVAGDGTVYIGGVTTSPDFPGSRAASFGPGGQQDAFIARLRPGDPNSLQTVLLGGKNTDRVSSVALDSAGDIFASGYTSSVDFPLKNPLQPRFGGQVDGFLVKLHISDWTLRFSSYLGGSMMDGAYGVAIDSSGNPIVSGVTESADFPATPAAFQPHRRGSIDAFITKLSADGGGILWSTFYGGSKANSDQYLGGSLAVDKAGRIWLTGMTNSRDLPARNPSQALYGGSDFDGFLAAFSSDGAKLCYASYFVATGHDILEGLAIWNHKVYASGLSSSTNLRQRGSQIQRGYGGGPYDAILIGLQLPIEQGCP